MVGFEATGPGDGFDLALLDQPGQPLVQLIDHLLLAALGHRPVDLGSIGGDTKGPSAEHGLMDVGGLEQFLGRDAPAVQAGAADLLLLHHGDPQTGAGAVERSAVAPGASTDDHHIKIVGALLRP